jgi:hypothetical protein
VDADAGRGALPATLRGLSTSGSAATWLLVVVVVQLAFSLRFFAKYTDAFAPVAYLAYVVLGVALCVLLLRSPRLLRLLSREPMLVAGIVCLVALVAVAYPVADALRDVGAGSDQDDCVRTLVVNVFSLRAPFGRGYFGDPCSTGPGELFVYWPAALTRAWFVVVPALCVGLGYAVLRVGADRALAVLLSLTQLCSWLFLELAATGSDMLLIGWLYAAAVACSWVGVRERRRGLLVSGGAAYCLFATSRLPLVLVAAVSALLLLLAVGARVWLAVAPAAAITLLLYAGSYALAPSRFAPGHLVAKSGRVVRDLADGPGLLALVAVGVLLVAGGVLAVRLGSARLVRRHLLLLQVAVLGTPMALVSLWDLLRRDLDPAAWEGLHYLYLAMPMFLVAAADRISRTAVRLGTPLSRSPDR